jgi:hypothetical protein
MNRRHNGTVASWIALFCGALAIGIAIFAVFAFRFADAEITVAKVYGALALVFAAPALSVAGIASCVPGLVFSRRANDAATRRNTVLSLIGIVCAVLTLAFMLYLDLSSRA